MGIYDPAEGCQGRGNPRWSGSGRAHRARSSGTGIRRRRRVRMSIRCCDLSKVHTLSTVEAILRCFSFSAQGDQGTRTAAGGFSDRLRGGCRRQVRPDSTGWPGHKLNCRRQGSPLTGSSFSAPPGRGTMNCRRRVRPNGQLLFLHRLTGAREPFCVSVFRPHDPGGEFFAEPQRGFAVCGRGDVAAPAAGRRRTHGGGQRKDTCGFPSSFELLPSLAS